MDHVKKSYSVGDVSAAADNTDGAVFDNNRELDHIDVDSDDELDNRLLAEQYNRDVAEMAANQRPVSYHGEILGPALVYYYYCCCCCCICYYYHKRW